jgi:hypothetical protein
LLFFPPPSLDDSFASGLRIFKLSQMAVDIENSSKMAPDVEHRQHADEKSSDSDIAGPTEVAWTEAEEKAVRNKVSLFNAGVTSDEHVARELSWDSVHLRIITRIRMKVQSD